MKILGHRFSRFVGVRSVAYSRNKLALVAYSRNKLALQAYSRNKLALRIYSRNKLALRIGLRNLNLKSQFNIFDSFRDVHVRLRFFEVCGRFVDFKVGVLNFFLINR